ncbi:glycosyltransferase family 4 protein [Archangium lansingense]|uniref:glycosyltransferase family 4 protein n=1 Tax=Archangium lansingense TaxID=2995310 RepID=UPI003B7F1428
MRIALPFEPRQHLASENPSGFHIVNAEFLHALARHGRSGELLLLAARANAASPGLGGEGAIKQTRVLDILELVRQQPSPEVDLLHDLSCQVDRALSVRGHWNGPAFPLTFVSHGLVLQLSLRALAFPLLLGGIQPFDSLICISHGIKRGLERLLDSAAEAFARAAGTDAPRLRYRGRLDVIHWAVDSERFGSVDRREARSALGIPQDAFVLLSIGRISPFSKGDLLPLLGLFRDLRASNPERNLRLVIAGSVDVASYNTVLQGHARALGVTEHIQWLGGVEPSRRHLVHAAADVFVSLNDATGEGFGLTPLEALASGVPQVVSDWDGMREMLVHGETGFLVPTLWANCDDELILHGLVGGQAHRDLWTAQSIATDMTAMRRALQSLIDSPELRARMGEASRLRAARMFSWKEIIRRYEELWQELVGLARASPPARAHMLPEGIHGVLGHYAAEQLEPGTSLKLTEAGERLLTKGEFVPLYGQPPPVEPERVVALLGALGARGGPCTLATLEQDTHATWGTGHSWFLRHVLWLLKFGLVEVERPLPGVG